MVTYSNSIGVSLQANGENSNTWGAVLNGALEHFDEAIAQFASIPVTGSATLTITDGTASSGNTDQARKALLILTGTPGAGFTLTMPEIQKGWIFYNNTDSTATITTTTGTTTVAIEANTFCSVYADGAGNVYQTAPKVSEAGLVPVSEIENVGATTISAAQWGYVGGADQAVKTTDSPTFNAVTTTAGATIGGAATIGTTLGVTGASTLASLGVTGNATVGGTFGTTGAATLAGITYPAADGLAGQFLKTDGAGTATFATPAGGGDLLAAANLSDLASASTARTNLGLGTAAIASAASFATITGTESLTNKTLTAPTITGTVIEDVYALTGTTPALEPANGSIQTWTLTANSTPTDSLVAGEAITLMIDDGTAYTITWPTITWVNNAGSAPTLATTGYTVIAMWKVSTTLYGALVGDGS